MRTQPEAGQRQIGKTVQTETGFINVKTASAHDTDTRKKNIDHSTQPPHIYSNFSHTYTMQMYEKSISLHSQNVKMNILTFARLTNGQIINNAELAKIEMNKLWQAKSETYSFGRTDVLR